MASRKNQKVSRLGDSGPMHTPRRILGGIARGLLRILLKLGQQPQWSRAGFILPTTVMLLMVVTLTVGSISLRTLNRTGQVIGDRQQRVIYNAATPAIDRAKAKLEFLFSSGQDERLPSGIPSEQQLFKMMLNNPNPEEDGGGNLLPGEVPFLSITAPDPGNPGNTLERDPYSFPDEERVDIGGVDEAPDNAWIYPADRDSDGTPDSLVIYSIIFGTPDPNNSEDASLVDQRDGPSGGISNRADKLQVRNAPLSSGGGNNPVCQNPDGGVPIEGGWFASTGRVRKNFQVNAVVIPITLNPETGQYVRDGNGLTTALEFQQDRKYNEGSKWGAWFRNDLEVFPGVRFNWNGAMHTEGNLIVGRDRNFTAFLVSSPASCLYDEQASEITIAEIKENNDTDLPPFVGQVIAGYLFNETRPAVSRFHIHADDPIDNGDDILLKSDIDSVKDGNSPIDLSLDPVKLLTEDVSVPRSDPELATFSDDAAYEAVRDNPAWLDRQLSKGTDDEVGRIKNLNSLEAARPKIDDFYRADNRLGPKPRYDGIEISRTIGDGDTSNPAIDAGGKLTWDRLTRNDGLAANIGLDGYWERRARNEGMRIIVGQRLELGNLFGWKSNSDPLYPWDDTACTDRCYEAKQRRTLRDNLAAVQALAVYHSVNGNDGDFPRFCMALTSHPGTPETLEASTTFKPLAIAPASGLLDISFFDGNGTNGWEYPAPATAATFADEIASNRPLGKALRNLAYFAGDPSGGAPSFAPVQEDAAEADAVIHPYPELTMWGDFSMLRRIFDDELDAGVSYASLSPADKTYLHTAACLVGMLANNVDTLSQYDYADPTNEALLNTLNTEISTALGVLDDDDLTNGEVDDSGTFWEFYPVDGDGSIFTTVEKVSGATDDIPAEAIFAALPADQRRIAQLIHLKEQVARDRQVGFAPEPSGYTCDILTADIPPELTEVGKLCPTQPKFPALYYLFPKESHLHDGTLPGGLPPLDGAVQPGSEAYIADPYIFDPVDPDRGVNDNDPFKIVGSGSDDFVGVALAPKATVGDWEISPVSPTAKNSNVINDDGTDRAVAMLDKSLFDGRQLMNTRVLDLDLDILRDATITEGSSTDTWLPKLSLVYAFREDAVREDMIVRPASAGPCSTDEDIQKAACLMDAVGDSQDPPLTSDKNISPKAVDYYADPDRRPFGFRLRNGASLKRDRDDGRGVSFISDDAVYIQGDFNLHQESECGTDACRIEEFDELLPEDGNFTPAQFYDDRTTLNPNFARPGTDFWRPSEILADAVTILSDNFCDGSIADGFLTGGERITDVTVTTTSHGGGFSGYDASDRYGCSGDRTSYLNQNRPDDTPASEIWRRENPFDYTAPISVNKNGQPQDWSDETLTFPNTDYYRFAQERSRIEASPTRVNAVIISGIVPSRFDQPYGGLHNFPRLLEDWRQGGDASRPVRLAISGAFIQLNFSNSSTAPYDQEQWEPTDTPNLTSGQNYRYYAPPRRVWGYDVGLQYAPAAPISKRFANSPASKSEFYSEPSVDDPYIQNLEEAFTQLQNEQITELLGREL